MVTLCYLLGQLPHSEMLCNNFIHIELLSVDASDCCFKELIMKVVKYNQLP